MLNIAGPKFDFANIVFAVIEECEHRRRGYDDDELEYQLTKAAKEKLDEIKAQYDEYGGGAGYWDVLRKEVLSTAVPQYIDEAKEMNRLERNAWGVWRQGDIGARLLFALAGLLIGSIIIALPFVPIFEDMFAFALTAGGFVYPDLKKFQFERRHATTMNRLVEASARYQEDARLHFLTTKQITDAFVPGDVNLAPGVSPENASVVEEVDRETSPES
ncbi:MAG TPA: hypothetical protein VN181_13520 [Thermoanaerobaculia bacterium]|nr:hypothetical protein [Thermoanaerobaculia bacterium]